MEKDGKSRTEGEGERYGLRTEVNSKRVDEGLSEEIRKRVKKEELGLRGNGGVLFTKEKDILNIKPKESNGD